MVGLHMLYNEVIWLSACEGILKVIKPLVSKACVHRIHNGNFFIKYDVAVIAHSRGDFILPFKQVNFVVIDTNVFYI